MSSIPSVEDLELVVAVHRHGSVGAAARELRVTQPSASARLATLERRLGTDLFVRDTTGARATPAGLAFAQEAAHILGHLGALADRTAAGAAGPLLRVATFPSLAAAVFPALDAVLQQRGRDVAVHQLVDHGDRLVAFVAEGSLDAAVVGIATQLQLPAGVQATLLGRDRLVMITAPERPAGSTRRPFTGEVPYHCVDLSAPAIEQRIRTLGGTPRRCATGEVAVLTGRASGRPVLLAGAIARLYPTGAEMIEPSPVSARFAFHLVTRTPPPPEVLDIRTHLAERMHLT